MDDIVERISSINGTSLSSSASLSFSGVLAGGGDGYLLLGTRLGLRLEGATRIGGAVRMPRCENSGGGDARGKPTARLRGTLLLSWRRGRLADAGAGDEEAGMDVDVFFAGADDGAGAGAGSLVSLLP